MDIIINKCRYELTKDDFIALNNRGDVVGVAGSLEDFTEQLANDDDNVCNIELHNPNGSYVVLKVEDILTIERE